MNRTSNIQCLQKEKYLDDRLSQEERMRFDVHLTSCDSCREQVLNWEYTSSRYAIWASREVGDQAPPTTREEAREFVRNLRNRMATDTPPHTTTGKHFPLRVLAPIAAVLIVAIATMIYWRPSLREENAKTVNSVDNPGVAQFPATPTRMTVQRISDSLYVKETIPIDSGSPMQSQSDERIIARIAGDTVGLANRSQLVIQQISGNSSTLQLLSGTAVFDVSPRSDGDRFTVIARNISISVIGTRFTVGINGTGVIVGVTEGTVLVERQSEKRILTAGNEVRISPDNMLSVPLSREQWQRVEQLLSVEQVDEPDSAAQPKRAPSRRDKGKTAGHKGKGNARELAYWQQLILDGKNAEATQLIQSYLLSVPDDGAALMLLATSQKKGSQLKAAFQTYEKVIALSRSPLANQARYLAGELAQDHLGMHGRAAALFQNYLLHSADDSPNRPEAKLRLAKALLRLSKNEKAKVILQEIIQEFGRTSVANRARNLLDTIP